MYTPLHVLPHWLTKRSYEADVSCLGTLMHLINQAYKDQLKYQMAMIGVLSRHTR